MTVLFALTLFVSSCLLFLVEPMFAKMILPRMGGAAAVWNTCMVFYQITLLAGYIYAHVSLTRMRLRPQIGVHLAILAIPLLVLPVGVAAGWRPPVSTSPIPAVLLVMLVSVGLPFLALSTSASVAQRWFSFTSHKSARDPYFLYVASNAGSIAGLIGYLVLFEPNFTLSQQSRIWTVGYVGFLLLMGLCAFLVFRSLSDKQSDASGKGFPETSTASNRGHNSSVAEPPLSLPRRLRWIALAFVPSSLTLGFTTSITANIAAVPLLWIVPLTIYLLTFMIAFSRRSLLPHKYLLAVFPALLAAQMIFLGIGPESMPWGAPVIQMLTFFTAALICHKELANDRPGPERLTEFYLLLALGGALGGVFNALVAPVVFRSAVEYPLVLILAAGLWKWPWRRTGTRSTKHPAWVYYALDAALPLIVAIIATVGINNARLSDPPTAIQGNVVLVKFVAAVLCLAFVCRPMRFALGMGALLFAIQVAQPRPAIHLGIPPRPLYQVRGFYGIHSVEPDANGNFHLLFNGAITHGAQCVVFGLESRPLTYYYPTGPVGQVFSYIVRDNPRSIGLIGLGAGSLAGYADKGQTWTFYEIDPLVVQIASNPEYFMYLEDARERGARVDVKLGDGRLGISTAPDGSYDVIVVDAFSGDSIPTHLLTSQAMRLYERKLRPHGLIAVHITSGYVDLREVVTVAGAEARLVGLYRNDNKLTLEEIGQAKERSTWILLARGRGDFGVLLGMQGWKEVRPKPGARAWTDDYSNILETVQWGHLLKLRMTSQ